MLPKIDLNVTDPKTTRYRRTHNTPVADTENRLNELYGAWKTVLCNSGMEAINTVFYLLKPDVVICDDDTYFETRICIDWLGIKKIQLENLNNLDALEKALKSASGRVLVCGDSPTTFGEWRDVWNISDIAHKYGAYVMMDNSIVSMYYSNPLRDGADIVVESYTKYVCGYGDTFAGGIAFSDSMKWLDEVEVPVHNPGLKSIRWVTAYRGNVVSQYAAYMVARGLETLAVRMKRHTESARIIYRVLKKAGINARYCGYGGLISLPGLGEDFCKKFKAFIPIGTFGCTYSNSDFFRSNDRYKEGFCARISVGLEDVDILIADLENAFGISLMKYKE